MIGKLLQKLGKKAPSSPTVLEQEKRANDPLPIDVTDADFAAIVLASEKLAVVDFWAEWCQPCQIMSAYVSMLARHYGDHLLVAALDVDENPAIPERYNIMGLPTLLFLRNGAEVDRVVGVEPYEAIKQKIEQYIH